MEAPKKFNLVQPNPKSPKMNAIYDAIEKAFPTPKGICLLRDIQYYGG